MLRTAIPIWVTALTQLNSSGLSIPHLIRMHWLFSLNRILFVFWEGGSRRERSGKEKLCEHTRLLPFLKNSTLEKRFSHQECWMMSWLVFWKAVEHVHVQRHFHVKYYISVNLNWLWQNLYSEIGWDFGGWQRGCTARKSVLFLPKIARKELQRVRRLPGIVGRVKIWQNPIAFHSLVSVFPFCKMMMAIVLIWSCFEN